MSPTLSTSSAVVEANSLSARDAFTYVDDKRPPHTIHSLLATTYDQASRYRGSQTSSYLLRVKLSKYIILSILLICEILGR